jgi:glycogenin
MVFLRFLRPPVQSSHTGKNAIYAISWYLFLLFLATFMLWTIASLFTELSHPPISDSIGRPNPVYDVEQVKRHLEVSKDSVSWKKFVPSTDAIDPSKKYAYASLLCDDAMIDSAQVLVYSMKQTNTPYPFLILLLPSVSETAELSLKKLGATPLRINMLDYPFPVNAEKVAINKMCRYSKLHIWSQVDYEKIVFVDMDMLIVRNLDDVFAYPEFSAVKDAGDAYNTGLFVLSPSMDTYKDMLHKYSNSPSYNQGDQGFINWYFGGGGKMGRDVKYSLPVDYNVMVKNQRFGQWHEIRSNARIFHLTSETKPWTFYFMHHKLWKENFEPSVFYQWNRAFNQVAEKLAIDVYAGSRPQLDSPPKEDAFAFDAESTEPPLQETSYRHTRYHYSNWPNLPRMPYFCDRLYAHYAVERYFISSKFSVLIHKFTALSTLSLLLESLQGAAFIETIFVSWPYMGQATAIQFEFPASLDKFRNSSPPVQFIQQSYPSSNNKFAPINALRTKALFLMSDEMEIPKWYDMELAFAVWKNHPRSLVGFRPYSSLKMPQLYSAAGPATEEAGYSLISSHGMFMASEYLFIYTCLLPQRVHKFVDECKIDTADLALNLLVMGMTSAPPIAVVPPTFNPKRWVPESPYEMPRKDKDGRVLGPVTKHKKKKALPFIPYNYQTATNSSLLSFFARSTADPDDNPAAKETLQQEEIMSQLFFNMNAYVETAFRDILTQNKDVESHFYEDNSALDATSLDNSKPLDVMDDPVTLKLKENALKDMAVQFFHFTDPTLAWNYQRLHGHMNDKKTVPKGLFVKNAWVASRYEKVPFTKMSLKKWRYMVKMGLINPTGNFILGSGKKKQVEGTDGNVTTDLSSQNPAGDATTGVVSQQTGTNATVIEAPPLSPHITLLQERGISDVNSVEGLSAVLGHIEMTAKSVSDSMVDAALPPEQAALMDPNELLIPVPHTIRPFKEGEPPFDSKLLKSKAV